MNQDDPVVPVASTKAAPTLGADGRSLDAAGEPAFPRDHVHNGHNGMSLRDYFAAKAMEAQIMKLHGRDRSGAIRCARRNAFRVKNPSRTACRLATAHDLGCVRVPQGGDE